LTATATEHDRALEPAVSPLKNGAKPHRLTDEDRRLAVEKRREKAEAAKQAKLEKLVPKAYRVGEIALDEAIREKRPTSHAMDAMKFVWEQVHGKAVARGELVIQAQAPWEQWTPEQRAYVLATLEARRALPAAGDTGG
jgi:hypothetical protein